MKLIVGLGNPGKEYQNTRHNVGFMVIDFLASSLGVVINKKFKGSLYTEVNIDGEKVILLKPQHYINLSGQVIADFMRYFKIDVNDILVVNDDLDLKLGTYKLKMQGGSAGHNGLKNIEQHLSTQEYKRLKIGISNNKDIDARDYVLGHFSKGEKEILEEILEETKDILIDFIKMDFINLMNKYNGRR
ncbi:MAG TPA: aminoacyl-tRNA hydrolase [Mollicutes bacterium]|nr:aminoacyl-tRNA hydrolase [Mollicutes bacterium]